MRKSQGFVTGVYLYAGIAVVVGVLGLACYALYQKSEAAEARAADLERQRDTAIQAVKDSEAEAQRVKDRAKKLDAALVARDGRLRVLEATNRNLKGEVNALKKTLPAEDQACLDRPLPDSLVKRLRD